MGDGLVEWMNHSLLNLRAHIQRGMETGRNIFNLSSMFIEAQNMQPQGCHHMKSTLGLAPPCLVFPNCQEWQCQIPQSTAGVSTKILELREMVEANIVESAE